MNWTVHATGGRDGIAAFMPIVAHAFGKRYDLPVPLWLFVFGGAFVVFLSFLLVLPRPVAHATAADSGLHDETSLRPRAPVRWTIAALFTAGLIVAGLVGSQEVAENIVPTFFWLLVWVGVPISCGVVGDWTRPLNPFAALARAFDRPGLRVTLLGDEAPLRWPDWLGWWPSVAFFFTAACGELIFNGDATRPGFVAMALVVYGAVTAAGGLMFGAERWTDRGELFSVLFATWGRLGFFRFGAQGRRGFGGGLRASFANHPSRITFVLLLLVSVSFDGLLSTPAWKTFRTGIPLSGVPYELLETAIFGALVLVAWALFGGFAVLVRRAGRLSGSNLEVLAGLLPSLLPIAFGYLVAHNAQYLVINGQLFIPLLGNPAGISGFSMLPSPFNDSYEINPNLLPSSVTWYFQVVLIVFVHIVAVVQAHQYLGRTSRTVAQARRSEWPWIAAMVGYTMTSLWLLAQPLVETGSSAAVLLHGAGTGLLAMFVP